MDIFTWLSETREGIPFLCALIMGGIGSLFYAANVSIFFFSTIPKLNPEKRHVSMVPPLGGLLIALAFLLFIPAPWKWLALIGLTDPCIFVLVYSIAKEAFGKSPENKKDKEDKQNNGD